MGMSKSELDRRFDHHPPPDPQTGEDHAAWRGAVKDLAQTLLKLTPECREQSLALTHLEDAMMWGNAAIARPH